MINRPARMALAVTWGLLLLLLSLLPGGPGGLSLFGIPHIDKAGHFGMYAIWTFLLTTAWQKPGAMSTHLSGPMLIGIGTGILLEFGQRWMDLGRSFELADMAANAVGAATGGLAARWWHRRIRPR